MKTALITGAAGGMGMAAAKRLISEGYAVFGLDCTIPQQVPEGMTLLQADLTNEDSVKRAFETIRQGGARLDCIVHLAGVYELDSLVEMEPAAFDRVFRVNLFAAFLVNRTFLPLLKEHARIVLTSSELAVLDPLPFTGIYGISKAALDKYAYALRMELQLLGYQVIVLRPGAVNTGLLDISVRKLESFCENTKLYRCNAARFRSIVDRVEARNVSPEKIAALIWHVLSVQRPHYVYNCNRNPLLLIMNALPDRAQNGIIKKLLE